MKKIEMDIQCQSCKGTGVYVGMAERDGAAVVCHTCKGNGKYKYKFEYEEFDGLKKREDVTRVFKQSYGFVIAPRKLDFKNIGEIDMTKEGVSYDDFTKGAMPSHIKNLACPMLADQSACHSIKGFTDDCDKLDGGCLLGRMLTSCKNQQNKLDCWKRFEQAQADR